MRRRADVEAAGPDLSTPRGRFEKIMSHGGVVQWLAHARGLTATPHPNAQRVFAVAWADYALMLWWAPVRSQKKRGHEVEVFDVWAHIKYLPPKPGRRGRIGKRRYRRGPRVVLFKGSMEDALDWLVTQFAAWDTENALARRRRRV